LAWSERSLAFPEFGQFYSGRFHPGTPIKVCCVYRFRHVRLTLRTQGERGACVKLNAIFTVFRHSSRASRTMRAFASGVVPADAELTPVFKR